LKLKLKHFGRVRVLIWTNSLLVILLVVSLIWSLALNWQYHQITVLEKDKYYNTLAGAIVEYYAGQKQSVSFVDIKTTLKLLDALVPTYFQNHEFKPEDFIALAVIESSFDKYSIGKRGERGMFQILNWKQALLDIDDPLANPFDIKINIRMSCQVLKQKYIERKTYKDSIIAYNGYVLDSQGQVIEKYWKSFLQAQKLIKELKERAKEL
jgi:soluble lytic murein transglycosylase-like protein